MCVINSIQAQNTLTLTTLKADSATVLYTQTDYTQTDSLRAQTIRTDTLCSAKDLCVHQDAKISGNVEVTGKVVAKSGILIDTNNVGIYKMYMQLPVLDSAQSNSNVKTAFVSAGPLNPTDVNPPIDYDPCESGQLVDPNTQQGRGGFIAKGIRAPNVDATIGMWIDWWTGNGMIDVMGQGLYGSGHGLYVNYNCGKNIYLGTGFGNGGDWQGKAGSKVYTGDYVEMRKKLQIGSPQYGTPPDPNNIALEVHVNSGTGIRAKTYTIHDPMLSVFNSNTGGGDPTISYNGRNTFVVYGDGKTKIRSLNIAEPILSIGKFNNSSSTDMGTEYFKVYADGKMWLKSSSSNMQMFTLNDGTSDVVKIYGDGKVIIGKMQVVGSHSDALLQVAGKAASKSFYVLKPTTWADDVFMSNYKIDLKAIEQYIQKYKHLPDIPSENEIKQNGYDINEMNALLLKKIEELYLIIIQQQKEIEKWKK